MIRFVARRPKTGDKGGFTRTFYWFACVPFFECDVATPFIWIIKSCNNTPHSL